MTEGAMAKGVMASVATRRPIEDGVPSLRARDALPRTLIENDGAAPPRPSEPDALDAPFSAAGWLAAEAP